MKLELKFFLGAHLALILYLFYETFDLISLLNDDSFADVLSTSELRLSDKQVIPKIIHQTYKSSSIPLIWQKGQQACKDLHPDYQYILWTDSTARSFIKSHYSWFLPTWDKYPYPIERADAIRYFILDHYGGIYIDLDDGCNRKLDPLLSLRAFVRKTSPTGISNDVLGSVPGHPFFKMAIANLKAYQHNWFVPYVTIMISTGPLFLSIIWRRHKRWGIAVADRVRILLLDDYKGHSSSFFSISKGDSWHQQDANFVKNLGNHLPLTVLCGFLIGFAVIALEYLLYLGLCLATCRKAARKIGGSVSSLLSPFLRWTGLRYLPVSLSPHSIPASDPMMQSASSNTPYGEEPVGFLNNWRNRMLRLQKRRSRKDSNVDWNSHLLEHNSDTDLEPEKGHDQHNKSDDSDSSADHWSPHADPSTVV